MSGAFAHHSRTISRPAFVDSLRTQEHHGREERERTNRPLGDVPIVVERQRVPAAALPSIRTPGQTLSLRRALIRAPFVLAQIVASASDRRPRQHAGSDVVPPPQGGRRRGGTEVAAMKLADRTFLRRVASLFLPVALVA